MLIKNLIKKANKIRTKLLLVINNELIKEKRLNNNLSYTNQEAEFVVQFQENFSGCNNIPDTSKNLLLVQSSSTNCESKTNYSDQLYSLKHNLFLDNKFKENKKILKNICSSLKLRRPCLNCKERKNYSKENNNEEYALIGHNNIHCYRCNMKNIENHIKKIRTKSFYKGKFKTQLHLNDDKVIKLKHVSM